MDHDDLGRLVLKRRGNMGIRAAAKEIGISPTTLSKIERGHIPDQKTLETVCQWLGEKPAQFTAISKLQIAFKADVAVSKETRKSLANLVDLAHEQFVEMNAEGE